jgi:hypothetical protein
VIFFLNYFGVLGGYQTVRPLRVRAVSVLLPGVFLTGKVEGLSSEGSPKLFGIYLKSTGEPLKNFKQRDNVNGCTLWENHLG